MNRKKLYYYYGDDGQGYYDEGGAYHDLKFGLVYWLTPAEAACASNGGRNRLDEIIPPQGIRYDQYSCAELNAACQRCLAWMRTNYELDWAFARQLLQRPVEQLRRSAALDFGMSDPPTLDWSDDVSIYAAMEKIRVFAEQPKSAAPRTSTRDDLTQFEEDVVSILREKGERMTAEQIARALDEKGFGSRSDGYRKGKLRELVRLNVLTSRRKKPWGYGLPEWG